MDGLIKNLVADWEQQSQLLHQAGWEIAWCRSTLPERERLVQSAIRLQRILVNNCRYGQFITALPPDLRDLLTEPVRQFTGCTFLIYHFKFVSNQKSMAGYRSALDDISLLLHRDSRSDDTKYNSTFSIAEGDKVKAGFAEAEAEITRLIITAYQENLSGGRLFYLDRAAHCLDVTRSVTFSLLA